MYSGDEYYDDDVTSPRQPSDEERECLHRIGRAAVRLAKEREAVASTREEGCQ